MAGHTKWEDIKHKAAEQRKQTTPGGLEIPVPTRESIFTAFKKIVQPVKKKP